MTAKKRQNYRHLPAFILMLLAQGEAHGGSIHSALKEILPHFHDDTAAVYRTLQQLEEEKSVTSVWDTSVAGPARRIYHITPLGMDKLDEWKADIEQRVANLNYFLATYKKIKE